MVRRVLSNLSSRLLTSLIASDIFVCFAGKLQTYSVKYCFNPLSSSRFDVTDTLTRETNVNLWTLENRGLLQRVNFLLRCDLSFPLRVHLFSEGTRFKGKQTRSHESLSSFGKKWRKYTNCMNSPLKSIKEFQQKHPLINFFSGSIYC